MPSKLKGHLTYANVTVTLLLFVVLGGGAYAAITIPKNSVGTKQLKRHAVTPSKVSPLTITRFKGQRGETGHDGAAVVARVRSTGSVHTPADHSKISVPLTSNTWTQAAGDLNLGPYGRISFTAPTASSCNGTGTASLLLEIDVDGTAFFSSQPSALLDGAQRTLTISGERLLFEPVAAMPHTATAKVSAVCEAGDFPADFTVTDLRFDFIKAS